MSIMRHVRRFMTYTGVGALIGAILAVISVSVIGLSSPTIKYLWSAPLQSYRSVIEILFWFGLSGAFVCGVWGATAVLFTESYVGIIVGGILGIMGGCVLGTISLLGPASSAPWPSPTAYPGVRPVIENGATGSYGLAQTQTYSVDASLLKEIKTYYTEQMLHYCVDEWQMEVESRVNKECYVAECRIPRLWWGQFFNVELCVLKEHIEVIHKDVWQD